MNYYCKHCGSGFSVPEGESSDLACALDNYMECPLCREYDNAKSYPMKAIPEFETVAQWEARKGREYPDTAPVYALDEKGPSWSEPFYFLTDLLTVDKDRSILLVATEAGKPPDNWRPE